MKIEHKQILISFLECQLAIESSVLKECHKDNTYGDDLMRNNILVTDMKIEGIKKQLKKLNKE